MDFRKLQITLLAVAAAILSGCVAQAPKVSDTRWPQAVVKASKAELREKFIGVLASNGAGVDEAGDSVLQFRIPDQNAGLAKAAFGCPACGDPYIKTTVILTEVAEGTQAIVQYWRVVPKANGAEERLEIDNTSEFNGWQKNLWILRDRYGSSVSQ